MKNVDTARTHRVGVQYCSRRYVSNVTRRTSCRRARSSADDEGRADGGGGGGGGGRVSAQSLQQHRNQYTQHLAWSEPLTINFFLDADIQA